MKRIGILCGREQAFPATFVDRINGKAVGEIRAEMLKLGGTKLCDHSPYAVIVDRASWEYPYYRTVLKQATLDGTIVINNPFWASADDRFFDMALAGRLGIAIPRAVVLPSKEHPERVVTESLRNLTYPLDWAELTDYVGFPAILRPTMGVHVDDERAMVGSVEELIRRYDRTGPACFMIQQEIAADQIVRCFCVGKNNVIPVMYDSAAGRYHVDHQHLLPDIAARIVRDAGLVNEALGYDVSTIDFAVLDGVAYAVDIASHLPGLDPEVITPFFFEEIVELMADLAIDYALHGKPYSRELRWNRLLCSDLVRD